MVPTRQHRPEPAALGPGFPQAPKEAAGQRSKFDQSHRIELLRFINCSLPLQPPYPPLPSEEAEVYVRVPGWRFFNVAFPASHPAASLYRNLPTTSEQALVLIRSKGIQPVRGKENAQWLSAPVRKIAKAGRRSGETGHAPLSKLKMRLALALVKCGGQATVFH
jgi:hypothetical protein